MVFSSLTFLVFFLPAVLIAYYACPRKYKNYVLLIFSLIFYAWGEPKWIFVMLLTVSVNYLSGLMILHSKNEMGRKFWMLAGVVLGLGFLFYFKYCGFILDNVAALFKISVSFKAPTLPIGISFYTFQVLTYTIDVYRGKVPAQKDFFKLLLYVSFFPQLIAGPIVNYKDIQKELDSRRIKRRDLYEGMMRFIVGFCKKILIANTCGEVVAAIDDASSMSVAGSWLMAFAYALQIYFDFSGYSDMAIGMGRMFGFHFLENFKHPYISTSITEFWRRWHVSLGSFFREYVYIPLGGNRKGQAKQIRNILIVWALTGIWHGASWNFLFWGLYYAVLLILEKLFFLRLGEKVPSFIKIPITMFFVLIGWVLFYYTDFSALLMHLKTMFGMAGATGIDAVAVYYFKQYFGFLALGVAASLNWPAVIPNLKAKVKSMTKARTQSQRLYKKLEKTVAVLQPIVLTPAFLLALFMLVGQSYNPFLYFRF